jgi:autotransporter translocation and assembly factor TamB
LKATSNDLLVKRDKSVTVRANANLSIQGPVNSGVVSGVVGITHSRFFREVEILPIGLPGNLAKKRPTRPLGIRGAAKQEQLVFPRQMQGWHFDVKIKTDDPFLIRSNLAGGSAVVGLTLNGTGAKPALRGQVEIRNLWATLPFSKLNVDYGFLYFGQRGQASLEPTLDIHGISELRDYRIDVYIFGTAQNPQTTFSSDPPLPQEDIVALLATGATVKEIGGSSDVLAGRAAVLLFDKIYRQIFKRNAPASQEAGRLQFDIGGVNATTGKQEVKAQFKLTDQINIIGEVGIEGGVGGKIQYVVRFR